MVTAALKSFPNQSKNIQQSCLKRFLSSSSSTKKRFQAKLRKLRWRIYQGIQNNKKRLKRHLKYYESQVKLFLSKFSTKLKSKETSIWTEKLAKTSRDVHTSLSDPKLTMNASHVTNVNIKPQVELVFENTMQVYMAKVDSALFMISSILHLVKKGKASELSEVPVKDAFDVTLKADAVADNLEMFEAENEDDVAKVAAEKFKVHTEEKVNATVEKSEALGDEKNAGRSLFKEISEDCVKCKKMRKKYIEAMMGPLTDAQLSISPVFFDTIVDLWGPEVMIKSEVKSEMIFEPV